jgi:DNA-binding transcriptional MerR regulator
MEEPRWTLDELAEQVDAGLAVDYRGQASRRVRAVPDQRAIRWYTTIGLIDRPVAHRGRTALYGPRHLLQLVAVKRLQAEGLPLVAIQAELAGATDTQLARVARLPAGVAAAASSGPAEAARHDGAPPRKGRAMSRRTAAGRQGASAPGASAPGVAEVAAAAFEATGSGERRTGFWRARPTAALLAAADVEEAAPEDASAGTSPSHVPSARPDAAGAEVATLRGLRLGDAVTLLLEPGRDLDADEVSAIRDAAQPLLAVLRDRGLDAGATRNPTPGPAPSRAGANHPGREHP